LEEWTQYWGAYFLWMLLRDVSDYFPLVLKVSGWDWGPKTFRFNNFWLEKKNFKELVEGRWRNYQVNGWMDFVLKEKLKMLKKIT